MWRQLAVGAALSIISERVTGRRLGVRTLLWASFIVQIVSRARHPGHKPILPGDLWCDDPQHQAYNTLCRAPLGASAETLRRSDPQYDLIIITDWNWPQAVPGLGSAIFMHQWRRPGASTAGCIAMARQNLVWLAKSLMPETRLIVR